jgi:hypothetical protein
MKGNIFNSQLSIENIAIRKAPKYSMSKILMNFLDQFMWVLLLL